MTPSDEDPQDGARGFAAATRVQATAQGRYRGEIVDGWDVAGRANGGYLLALAARALGHATDRPDPVSITGHYLSAGAAGPIEIETEVLRTGQTFSTARASLVADRPLLSVLATFCDLGSRDAGSSERVDGEPPDLPAPERCVEIPTPPGPRLMQRVELRLHPEDARFAFEPSGRARMRGWLRLRDDEPHDAVALLLAVDAFPPTIFNAGLPTGWVPTLELTAHVRRRPAAGWLRCSFLTRFVTDGFLEVDGEIWDQDARLVAQSRQLALLPRG